MQKIFKKSFGKGKGERLFKGDEEPRRAVYLLEEVWQRVANKGASRYVKDTFELEDEDAIRDKLKRHYRLNDEYNSWFDEHGDESLVVPEGIRKITTQVSAQIKELQGRLSDTKEEKQTANKRCGEILEYIREACSTEVKEKFRDIFGSTYENYEQVNMLIGYIRENYLGNTHKVFKSIEEDIRNHVHAKTVREAKILMENFDLLYTEMTFYHELITKSLDSEAMNKAADKEKRIYLTCRSPLDPID